MITESAPAKINLALHIRRKRPDGYHDLETLFAFARDGDLVSVNPAERDSFTVTGPFASSLSATADPNSTPAQAGAQLPRTRKEDPPLQAARSWTPAFAGEEDNLCISAVQAFRAFFSTPPLAITLDKHLPVASGIGGGSADAAATLRALARLNDVDPADPRILATARDLGADVPACLLGQTAFATGRGDDLAPLPSLGDVPLLLVNPLVPLSTAAMFAAWDGVDRGPLATTGSALERARVGRNDFTAPAIAHAPAVVDVLGLLAAAPGCTFARLSGSGATCFGLFADTAARDSAAANARARGWWALPTLAH